MDPRIVQGFLTLAAALVASGTAMWIAYQAYPRQKAEDRRLQKEHERREIYRRFLNVSNSHLARLFLAKRTKEAGESGESYVALVGATSELAAYLPSTPENDVLQACQKYSHRILEYGVLVSAKALGDEAAKKTVSKDPDRYPSNLFRQVQIERRRAVIAIRRDLGDTEVAAKNAANVFFVETPLEELE